MALRFWFTLSVWKNFVLLFFKSLDEARNWHNTPSNSKSQWCTFKLSAAEADINTWKMTLLQSKSSLGCMFVQKKSVCFYLSIPISPSLSPCFFPFSSHLFSLQDPLFFFSGYIHSYLPALSQLYGQQSLKTCRNISLLFPECTSTWVPWTWTWLMEFSCVIVKEKFYN